MTKTLVMVRHGQSEWNLANKFTGWVDVDLSEKGEKEAIEAGKKIKEAGIVFDHAHTSILKRAIKTCNYVLEYSEQLFVPVEKTWRLNERHYGALQGLNKAETAEKYGDEQVHIWRRSYDTLPPTLSEEAQEEQLNMRQFKNLPKDVIPTAENLKITLERALPYFFDNIAPQLLKDETVLVAAHGNSLRALAKHIEGISDEDIMDLEIPTGQPLVYELDDDLKMVKKYYL
ncbi:MULTISPECIES: 2,3-diphosphoglycerate-dependent phosphoglycerate mutase [Anaerococcus]|jgi:2,3-bisphosphoglycerate-dependent phosphoglycerate mutase|uniref:2,3-bisphosphoglycerate-dependent phosphoglycerate mutase n=1 Tax=Anaerococcus octavius TaxID=54007 RepID=A0A380WWY3_9FIRM|nr:MULTISPECIES: 2,3-diphosphoglycerate-dependent phosphoglycerate mutase [Anaerococcus]MBS6106236.1 2,3-diphosphoglycerate-dependent phosphoglycerate mutase [Anaerococcus sp.]MDU0893904.1 2,3-diphosphoglycerate-dependent phosphoglycerate mutase [Anaerococcus sp.]MDU2598571.1 2,3-diphosphoglycerate-dependent phosphoglycerate mutase [Anaerococcus sp.]MDU3176466.1 2,3-diphosphoglycerate-dependent phosphoglycerate mutase [Anaerococcus sp.]MDU4026327.1 2,3-diphosphoglycerate-dependent phosphoglyce